MGIKERKQKHKENLKQNILDAAKMLFLKDGYEATSIRRIAAEIEFSPTTIYLYYKDKAEIAHALHQEGFKILGEQFRVLAHIGEPFERLITMGKVYMQFALENRDYYELMFVMKDAIAHLDDQCADDHWEEGQQAFRALLNTITHCQVAGYFKGLEPEAFSLMVWSSMHGLCTLKIHGHLDHVVSHKEILTGVDDVFAHAFDTFVQMLERIK